MKKLIIIFIISFSAVCCSPPPGFYKSGYKASFRTTRNYRTKKKRSTGRYYRTKGRSRYSSTGGNRSNIVSEARKYLGIKYKYGGTTPRGFDCSGFVMYVYKKNGIKVPRSAKNQFYKGKRVRFKSARPGDLLFFETSRGRISHVAIYLGRGKFIHSPSTGKRIRVDSVTNRYWKKSYIGTVSYI